MTQRFRRKTGSMSVVLLALLLLSITTTATKAEEPVHAPSVTERPASSKPFWIDKGIFTSEDWLFVVGVATGSTQEEARSKSLDAAKRELTGHLKNYSDMQGLETKELWEEKNTANGTFTTYRLLVLKLRDWTPLLVDKSKVEEVAQILARVEERKAQALTDKEQANAARHLIMQWAKALHMSDIDVWALGENCKMKNLATQNWKRALTPESRKKSREYFKRDFMSMLSRRDLSPAEEVAKIERQVDDEIASLRLKVDQHTEACETLKEADVLIAAQEQKQAEPLKRLRYWEDRLWKERFPNGHPAGAAAETAALASPRK